MPMYEGYRDRTMCPNAGVRHRRPAGYITKPISGPVLKSSGLVGWLFGYWLTYQQFPRCKSLRLKNNEKNERKQEKRKKYTEDPTDQQRTCGPAIYGLR